MAVLMSYRLVSNARSFGDGLWCAATVNARAGSGILGTAQTWDGVLEWIMVSAKHEGLHKLGAMEKAMFVWWCLVDLSSMASKCPRKRFVLVLVS